VSAKLWPVFVGRRQMSGCVARAAATAVAAATSQVAATPATSPTAAAAAPASEKAAVACHLQLSSIICQTKPTIWSPMPHCISHRQLLWQMLPFRRTAALRTRIQGTLYLRYGHELDII